MKLTTVEKQQLSEALANMPEITPGPNAAQEPLVTHYENEEPPDDIEDEPLPRSQADERVRLKMRQCPGEAEMLESNIRRKMPLAALEQQANAKKDIRESLEKARSLLLATGWPRGLALADEIEDIMNSSVFWE